MINLANTLESCKIESSNDLSFVHRIYKEGLNPYADRLKQYGFENHNRVLDAGCGFGQWSLALASLNKNVDSCDADEKRVHFLNNLATQENVENVSAQKGFIDNLPYDDETFDAVFCYGVLIITPWKKSLSEFVRVLKPNGKIYLNANGFGWYKHLWKSAHNRTDDYDPQLVAANAWKDTYRYNNDLDVDFPTHIIIEKDDLILECQKLGLTSIEWDGEGLLNNPKNRNCFFQKEYHGDLGVYELMAKKT